MPMNTSMMFFNAIGVISDFCGISRCKSTIVTVFPKESLN